MTAALDLGSSEFRSLRREGQRLIARRLKAAYTVLEETEATRNLLDKGKISYSLASGQLVVVGDAAEEVAKMFSRPLIPLLTNGELDEQDQIGRQVSAWMIDLLLPMTSQPHQLCMVSFPRGDSPEQANDNWTAQFFEHVIQLQGYDTMIMHPGTAVTLSELEETQYTGIGMTFGPDIISFSLTHHSRPIVEARFKQGFSEILERFCQTHQKLLWDSHGNSYLDRSGIQQWLRGEECSLSAPHSAEEVWLRDACEEWLLGAWFSFKRKIQNCHESILNQPLPIVLSGDPVAISGFPELVRDSLRLSGIPIQSAGIRTAAFDPFAVARGLYLQGELHSGSDSSLANLMEAA